MVFSEYLESPVQAEWPRAIAELVAYPHIEEAAILSTCNRMELYVVALSRNRVSPDPMHTCNQQQKVGLCSWHSSASQASAEHLRVSGCVQGIREVEEWMSRSSGISLQKLMPHLFCYTDRDATEHLLR